MRFERASEGSSQGYLVRGRAAAYPVNFQFAGAAKRVREAVDATHHGCTPHNQTSKPGWVTEPT
jgi:hypothetical protein